MRAYIVVVRQALAAGVRVTGGGPFVAGLDLGKNSARRLQPP